MVDFRLRILVMVEFRLRILDMVDLRLTVLVKVDFRLTEIGHGRLWIGLDWSRSKQHVKKIIKQF